VCVCVCVCVCDPVISRSIVFSWAVFLAEINRLFGSYAQSWKCVFSIWIKTAWRSGPSFISSSPGAHRPLCVQGLSETSKRGPGLVFHAFVEETFIIHLYITDVFTRGQSSSLICLLNHQIDVCVCVAQLNALSARLNTLTYFGASALQMHRAAVRPEGERGGDDGFTSCPRSKGGGRAPPGTAAWDRRQHHVFESEPQRGAGRAARSKGR